MIVRLRLALSIVALICALPPAAAAAADLTKMTIATGVDPSFSIFYIAKLKGFFQQNGLDVDLRTGPSGGAMVPLLISNDSNASLSAAFAGVNNHLQDPDIVAVAQVVRYDRWFGIVSKSDVKSVADLKGKKVAITRGNASESYWYDVLKYNRLNPDDFKASMVNIEAPEMVAAIERGDVQAFSAWEPWLSRAVLDVPNTKVLVDNIGKVQDVGFIYMSRKWIQANRPTAIRFMKAMVESNAFIHAHPGQTKELVGKMLNTPAKMLDAMMPKVTFTLGLGPDAYSVTKRIVDQQVAQGRIKQGQFDYNSWFDPDLLRQVSPNAVTLPPKM